MKASPTTADELISMDSKKLDVPPSSSQQGTLKVSNATTITTSSNTPSMLVHAPSVSYTSSARHRKAPFSISKVTGPGSYRL
jgi:hypothetical protein